MFDRQKKEIIENSFDPNKYKIKNINEAIINHQHEIADENFLIIQNYYQKNINAGIILGMPLDLSCFFKESNKLAEKFFESKKYLTIQPTIFTDDEKKSYLLPNFLTMATIDRTIPLEGDSEYFSSINVIWWQNTLGNPEEEAIELLKNAEWKKPYAWSWDM